MANALQTTDGVPRHDARKLSTVVVLTALGVVYGDIGTSTLYGLKQAVDAGGGPEPETVMGIVSLIFWALLLIVGLKYAILILRADNHGEGGIVALLALLDARHAPRGSARASLLIVGLIGAALLYGDGVITPAISVLSAVEGLKIDAPALAPMVVPITIAILMGLFLVQRKGTEFVGNIFGPVMLVWFKAQRFLPRSVPITPFSTSATRDPASPLRCSAPPFWRSPAQRPCMPIWVISAGCRSNSDGSRSCRRR
jgi:KUP system potassium uptake protein